MLARLVVCFWVLGGMALADMSHGSTAATYDVRLLGVKVGQMAMAGRVKKNAYVVKSEFSTKGLVGTMARASFDLQSRGRVKNDAFQPTYYSEDINTGRRQSSARLVYTNGVPEVAGGTLAAEDDLLDPRTEKGTLDPLSGMFFAMRDQHPDEVCKVGVTVFDGARRSRFEMTERIETDTGFHCTGAYRRIAGFSDRELKRQTVFPVAVDYRFKGEVLQAVRVEVRSVYGKAVLVRR